ncbi:MAG: RNA polymerase sigma factor [Bacillus subtilis]|nr:RNA polymerase sigma factor [Bacillus subtilis]
MANLDDYLDRLEDRDEAAFQIVYDLTKKGVYAMIVAIVKNRKATEDLMQETYMKMLQNLDSYQRGRNFAAWLFQIAKNLAYDYLRKIHGEVVKDPLEEAYVFDQVVELESNDSPSMEEMLAPLDPVERQIVLLRVVNDTAFKDISSVLDKPLGTVLWLYQRALKKMKRHLEGGERG